VTSCKSAGSSALALVSIRLPRPPPAFATRTSTRPDDTRDHCLDRFVVADIDLDPQSGATRRLNLGDGAVGSYVFGFGLEFLYERRFRSAESPFPL
jgi:hypothetical protein